MRWGREFFRSSRRSLPVLVGVCAVVYFGYHAVRGENGAMAFLSLERRVAQAEIEFAAAKTEEERLARRVELLRPRSLDRDMLDEQARILLNLAHPDDLVVMRDDLRRPLR